MFRYFIRRLIQLVPVFFITTFLIFLVVRIIPGDPVQAQFGENRVGRSHPASARPTSSGTTSMSRSGSSTCST